MDESYVKVAGHWVYLYRAVDRRGQIIDVLVSERRDGLAARAFFSRALRFGPAPVEVTTDRAPVYPRVIDDVMPAARHLTEQYANNRIEADHGRLKSRLRPMRALKKADGSEWEPTPTGSGLTHGRGWPPFTGEPGEYQPARLGGTSG